MTEITLQELTADEAGHIFKVVVSDGEHETTHTVSLTRELFERLGGDRRPEELVRESFRFLLARESAEAILSSFDLGDISTYFPEFEAEMKGRRGTEKEDGRALLWFVVMMVVISLGVLSIGVGYFWNEITEGLNRGISDSPPLLRETDPELTFTDSAISLNGEIVLESADLPAEVAVTEEAAFGGAERFVDAALLPDGERAVFVTVGAAHSFGWLLDIPSGDRQAVVFSYGGGVEIGGWSEDGVFIDFMVTTPAPSSVPVLVDSHGEGSYVSERGVSLDLSDHVEGDLVEHYERLGWDGDVFCLAVDGDELCFTAEGRLL